MDSNTTSDVAPVCDTVPDIGDSESAEEILRRAVEEFLDRYPAAVEVIGDIAKELKRDKSLCSSPYCLECAMGRVLGRIYRTPAQLMEDSEFRERYVLPDKAVREAIIDAYLQEVRAARPPKVMGDKGFIAVAPSVKAGSLGEAGQLLERMLKDRRIK
ncbi:MAG: hypothetical protein K2M44_05890 [Clostridia bacterium]|nr:hypothetical protein [Clostridia bacterium]